MKVETSQVTKLLIRDVKNLDVIAVYLEDFTPGVGKATITCANDSWSYGWSAMGERSIREFLIKCDTPYLANKFGPDVPRTQDNPSGLPDEARKHVLEKRMEDRITRATARDLYDRAYYLSDMDPNSNDYADLMYDIFGDEWWDNVPSEPNHHYLYLCRIIDTVKEALKEAV